MALPVYPSDLTEQEWDLLAPLIPAAKPGGRPRSADMRRITNGIFYVLRSGCAWRYLPREYGVWSTVYYYFRRWRLDGTWAAESGGWSETGYPNASSRQVVTLAEVASIIPR
jgi:hypothetical protein